MTVRAPGSSTVISAAVNELALAYVEGRVSADVYFGAMLADSKAEPPSGSLPCVRCQLVIGSTERRTVGTRWLVDPDCPRRLWWSWHDSCFSWDDFEARQLLARCSQVL